MNQVDDGVIAAFFQNYDENEIPELASISFDTELFSYEDALSYWDEMDVRYILKSQMDNTPIPKCAYLLYVDDNNMIAVCWRNTELSTVIVQLEETKYCKNWTDELDYMEDGYMASDLIVFAEGEKTPFRLSQNESLSPYLTRKRSVRELCESLWDSIDIKYVIGAIKYNDLGVSITDASGKIIKTDNKMFFIPEDAANQECIEISPDWEKIISYHSDAVHVFLVKTNDYTKLRPVLIPGIRDKEYEAALEAEIILWEFIECAQIKTLYELADVLNRGYHLALQNAYEFRPIWYNDPRLWV